MKLEDLFNEASDFLSGKKKKQQKKSKDLKNIIGQLVSSRDRLKKEHKNESNQKRQKSIAKEYKAVVKLLSKAKKRYNKIK